MWDRCCSHRRFAAVAPPPAAAPPARIEPGDDLPPLIPRAVLFGNPERVSPRLSPDGRRLAYLAPHNGVLNVFVRTVGQRDDRPVTHETIRPLRAFYWAEDSRRILFPQDIGGDENFHLYVTGDVEAEHPAAAASVRDLTPFANVRASLAAHSPRHPGTVLIAANQRDSSVMDVYRADLETGALTRVCENPGSVVSWIADDDLRVRAAVATTPEAGSEIWARDDEHSEWRTLLSFPFGESGTALGFDKTGTRLYVASDKAVNTQRLYALDVQTGAMTLLHAREDADLDEWLIHPTEKTVQAVGYNRSRIEWVSLDPALERDFAALRRLAPGDFYVVSRDNADTVWIVLYVRDDAPFSWFVYDRATNEAEFLFFNRPELDGLPLATMTPLDITARDGMVLPAYLTLPPGREPERLPLVLAVHGGPWARNVWGLSADAQWLANRGYAVLEVNYRGSKGFGKAHLNAGNREWGAKMHDDLVDAVQWAVAEGIADPARVAVYGGSYGGYAALAGLTFTPELFACGVDIVGPSNLITLLNSIPPYWKPLKAQFVQRVGDPDTEPDFLKERSPLFHADKIVRPLLIAQGANDPRVKQAESDQIVQAMRSNGQPVTYLLFEDEGHGFARPENQFKFRAAAEKFLAEHLGGRCEPAHPGEEPPLVS